MDKIKPESYKSVKAISKTEEVIIDKSRFIGYAAHTLSEEEAKDFLSEVAAKHPDASCICHAYILGVQGLIKKFYDGHEPVGGMPILEAISMKGLTAVTCAVVRYFGGVKLGVGGLARAFSNTASKAIELAQPCEYVLSVKHAISFDYTFQGKIEYMLKNSEFIFDNLRYTDKVSLDVYAKRKNLDKLNGMISAITNGSHTSEIGEEFYKAW